MARAPPPRPAPPGLAASAQVQAMARLAGVDVSALREVRSADQPLGAILAGRDPNGRTCLAVASVDAAGSFDCAPFAHGPLYFVAGARGTPARVSWAGFVGAASASVSR